MRAPSQRQFDYIHAVVRNARFEGMSKSDFLEWSSTCWDAHEEADKRARASEPQK